MVLNFTVTDNEATFVSAGIKVDNGSEPTITNCILWGNSVNGTQDETAQIYIHGNRPLVEYCCIKDGNPDDSYIPFGGGDPNYNIDNDPCFADAANDDFHLKSQVGRWNGSSWITDSVASLCLATGDPDDDNSNEPTPNGDRINMGAYGNTSYASKVLIPRRTELDKIFASDGASEDRFGWSVSISGDYAIVGAYRDDDNGTDSGSAYIFKRDGTSWAQQAKLTASDGAQDDWFGISVSISGDYAIVGAQNDDDEGTESGAAYIFKRDSTSWSQQAKIIGSDCGNWARFGSSVSIDGDYAIIGAPEKDGKRGYAYVFKREGTSWTEQDILAASDGETYDRFGVSVSIEGDYTVIGALEWDPPYPWDDWEDVGAAYIFKRDGTSWTEQAILTGSNTYTTNRARFGMGVSISGDYVIVGAPGRGECYIFKRNGTSWSEQVAMMAPDLESGDNFGHLVSISGNYAIVGAKKDDDNGEFSGSAYVLRRDDTDWVFQSKILASDGAYREEFSQGLYLIGNDVFIGSFDEGHIYGTGSVYIFEAAWP